MLPATVDRFFHRLSHLKKQYREHLQRFGLVAVGREFRAGLFSPRQVCIVHLETALFVSIRGEVSGSSTDLVAAALLPAPACKACIGLFGQPE